MRTVLALAAAAALSQVRGAELLKTENLAEQRIDAMQNNVIGSLPIEAMPIFRPLISYPLGWGQPSKHRPLASKPPYVAPQYETRQQRRARQRAEVKAFNRKDSKGNYVNSARRQQG